jgi:hypothetical protein
MTRCNRCGADLSRGEVTIYTEVNGELKARETICHKCSEGDKLARFQQTGVLTNSLFLLAIMQSRDETNGHKVPDHVLTLPAGDLAKLIQAQNLIHNAIKVFESRVWFKGLQSYIQKARWKGHSAVTSDLKVLMYAIAGRVMITMENPSTHASVTIITDEDSSKDCMGLQGIDSTLSDALGLLEQAIKRYDQGELNFNPDNEVSIL